MASLAAAMSSLISLAAPPVLGRAFGPPLPSGNIFLAISPSAATTTCHVDGVLRIGFGVGVWRALRGFREL